MFKPQLSVEPVEVPTSTRDAIEANFELWETRSKWLDFQSALEAKAAQLSGAEALLGNPKEEMHLVIRELCLLQEYICSKVQGGFFPTIEVEENLGVPGRLPEAVAIFNFMPNLQYLQEYAHGQREDFPESEAQSILQRAGAFIEMDQAKEGVQLFEHASKFLQKWVKGDGL